jgi:hypothetical protein
MIIKTCFIVKYEFIKNIQLHLSSHCYSNMAPFFQLAHQGVHIRQDHSWLTHRRIFHANDADSRRNVDPQVLCRGLSDRLLLGFLQKKIFFITLNSLSAWPVNLTMIFGSVAYRGSFSRKSALITAGSLHLIVSNPPSTSLVTVISLSPCSTYNQA